MQNTLNNLLHSEMPSLIILWYLKRGPYRKVPVSCSPKIKWLLPLITFLFAFNKKKILSYIKTFE